MSRPDIGCHFVDACARRGSYAHGINRRKKNVRKDDFALQSSLQTKSCSEIESGQLTASSARRLYDIKGADTIARWLNQFGKLHLLNQVVRIEMKDEKDRIKELEREKRKLESTLAPRAFEEYLLGVINRKCGRTLQY